MKEKLLSVLSNLKKPTVLLATLTNIWVLLETVDVLNFCGVTQETYMKVVGIVIFILIQLGIIESDNSSNIVEEFKKSE